MTHPPTRLPVYIQSLAAKILGNIDGEEEEAVFSKKPQGLHTQPYVIISFSVANLQSTTF
jgi:hypothetical protein